MNGTLKAWNKIEALRQAVNKPQPIEKIWQWAARSVDYSLATSYDTPLKGPYDPDFMPFWKEPSECLTDYTVKEVVALKCSRAGGTENLLLNAVRYAVGARPQPTLYVTGDQLSAERMMEKRIKRSFQCSKDTARQYRMAHDIGVTQHDISFPSMDFRVTWPKAKQAFKQDGWSLVLCDEVSTWPEYSADMARKRCDSYPFAHIVFISSPDPQQKRDSNEDPIFVEYENGDMRRWYCPDPAGGNFVFQMGSKESWGLHWDQSAKREDGTWDYDAVEKSAYFVTPAGTRIDESDRMRLVRAGHWEPTRPEAKKSVRSYHVNAFMIPFRAGSFGEIAVAFLKAKKAGTLAMRSFVYEYLAEKWSGKVDLVIESELKRLEMPYARGDLVEAVEHQTFLTVDMQKTCMYYMVGQWYEGRCRIVDYGAPSLWQELEEVDKKYSPAYVLIDNSYYMRQSEVFQQSMEHKYIPTYGRSKLPLPYMQRELDPFEGKTSGGQHRILTYTFNPDIYKAIAMDMLNGICTHKAEIFQNPPLDLVKQLVSEECENGEWRIRRGHSQNHLWDCFVLQVLCADITGLLKINPVPPSE